MNLLENPFFLLGASARDDRRRLLDLAEGAPLTRDPSLCTKARADLSNPRSRLAAETAWLPGVSPRQAIDLLQLAQAEPVKAIQARNLPPLAKANLIASSLQRLKNLASADSWVEWCLTLAGAFEEFDIESLLVQINEDRGVAGFPLIPSAGVLGDEIAERRRFYRVVLRDSLDQLPTEVLIIAFTRALDLATAKGTHPAPTLIDDLVDAYQVETKQFLEKETANVGKLIETIRKAAAGKAPIQVLENLVSDLEGVLRNWDRIAQPIQLSLMARGTEHEESTALASRVRQLAVWLFNEHGLLHVSERLEKLLAEVFAEVSEMRDDLEEDLRTLGDIRRRREQSDEQSAENRRKWLQEIYIDLDIGALFKKKFRISADGIQYGSVVVPLGKVSVARWGGVRKSVNGIPVGTTYQVAFGTDRFCSSVKLPNEHTFQIVTDKLWKATVNDIISGFLRTLKAGSYLSFPGVNVSDDGITIAQGFFGSKKTFFPWSDVLLSDGPGFLLVGPKSEPLRRVQLSYLEVNNVHFLEALLRTFFQDQKARRLTDLFA